MLESQAELIKSLKDENARNKEAASGAVAAADSGARRRRAPNPPRMTSVLKKDLTGADAAIERLEKALEEVTARRDSAEDAAADARREIAERDQMLAYVSSEVESVKSMFAQRESTPEARTDDALARLAERDDADDELKAEARAASGECRRREGPRAEASPAGMARVASIDERERAATEKVRRVEAEMRALLQEVAQHKRQSQAPSRFLHDTAPSSSNSEEQRRQDGRRNWLPATAEMVVDYFGHGVIADVSPAWPRLVMRYTTSRELSADRARARFARRGRRSSARRLHAGAGGRAARSRLGAVLDGHAPPPSAHSVGRAPTAELAQVLPAGGASTTPRS